MWLALKGLATITAIGLLLTGSTFAQVAKRLILTDGSYQTATEWTKNGDRVRYFSTERGEWEELPTALVDWKATDDWNAARSNSQEKDLKQATEEDVVARKEDESNTPQVAAGLHLPADGGVFLLEELAGKPTLHKVAENKTQEDDHEAENILKHTVIRIADQVLTIELKGAAAKVRVHSPTPSIFVDSDRVGAESGDNWRIVRLERKKGLRVVAENKVEAGGEKSQKEKFLHARAERFGGDWWKLIPLEDLTPGEYAVVVSAPGEDGNGVVWDFGVDK
jgi:hypothetical protein